MMTSPAPHIQLQGIIHAVNAIPDPQIRFLAMLGLIRVLPHDEEETVELNLVPALAGLRQVEGFTPRGRFFGEDGSHVDVDSDDQLPRAEFYDLLERVAAWDSPAPREAALSHIITMVVSTPEWVAW